VLQDVASNFQTIYSGVYVATMTSLLNAVAVFVSHDGFVFNLRFDIFFFRDFFELKMDNPAKLYQQLCEHLRSQLPECHVDDLFWETDPIALRLEMGRNCNAHCEGPLGREEYYKWRWWIYHMYLYKSIAFIRNIFQSIMTLELQSIH